MYALLTYESAPTRCNTLQCDTTAVRFQTGRVSVERIVSGRGIVNVYEFLYDRECTAAKANGTELSEAVQAVNAEVLAEVAEGGKIVGAHEHDDYICAEAMEIMISAYGTHP